MKIENNPFAKGFRENKEKSQERAFLIASANNNVSKSIHLKSANCSTPKSQCLLRVKEPLNDSTESFSHSNVYSSSAPDSGSLNFPNYSYYNQYYSTTSQKRNYPEVENYANYYNYVDYQDNLQRPAKIQRLEN